MAVNECIPRYEGAYCQKLTGHAAEAVVGKRFVSLEDTWQSGPGLSDTAEGGNLRIGVPGAGANAFGVSAHDISLGGKGAVYRGEGVILPVTSGAAVAHGVEVQCDAAGKAITLAAGRALGRVVGPGVGAADLDLFVELYKG